MEGIYRKAEEKDLEELVAMLSDDALGREREDTSRPLNPKYPGAFEEIRRDPNQELIVVEHAGKAVGMMQLTSDKRRPDALRFYEKMGFEATHEGFKLRL